MINYIDFLSPPITLYHLERRTHTSKIGGILVILMISLIVIYISFLLYQLITHKNMISIFHKQYQFEAGYYSFNSSSLFHFIQFYSIENGGYFNKYDSKYIRIYTTYAHSNDSDLNLCDHWVFDTCKSNDIKHLEPSLFSNVYNFTNSACIRYYYNSTEKKYYTLGDKNFFWPYLEHGVSQKNNIYLTTIVQKCTNTSFKEILGECPPQKEIDNYLNNYYYINLYFTDIQVDPTNYKYPLQKYLKSIITKIGNSQNFEENYIYYSPLKIRTKEGSFFGRTKDINSFYFDYNRKDSNINNNKYFTITKYYHFLQNNVQIYERIYNNLFDLFSEIGGIIQLIFYIFFWTNFIYNKYIIAYDTYLMFFSIQNSQSQENKLKKRSIIKFNNKMYHSSKIRKYSIQNINTTNNTIINLKRNKTYKTLNKPPEKVKDLKNKKTMKTDYITKEMHLKFYENINKNLDSKMDKNLLNIDQNSSHVNLKGNNNILKVIQHEGNKLSKNGNIRYMSNKEFINRMVLSQKSLLKMEHNDLKFKEIFSKEKNKSSRKHFAFIDYIKSFCFKKNKGSYNFLNIFRRHLLSEEHLLKNHIKIILLEKHNNFKTEEYTNILESYNEL